MSELAGPIFNGLINLGKHTLKEIKDSREGVQTFESIQQYPKRYREEYTTVSSLFRFRQETISLKKTYTQVQLLQYPGDSFFRDIKSLREDVDGEQTLGGLKFKKAQKLPGIEVARKHPCLAVLGGPGSGKSTFLKKLGLEELDKKNQEGHLLPVFIELKDFGHEPIDLEEYIARRLSEFGVLQVEKIIEEMLRCGSFLILLDGLDEVSQEHRAEIVKHIKEFSNKNRKNRFVLSCRIADFNESFKDFKRIVIADFDDVRIEDFINNWFQNNIEIAKKLWHELQYPQHSAVKELARTPLILTFLCLAYESSKVIPPNRSQLYSKALDIILDEWDAEKNIEKPRVLADLNSAREQLMLTQIAYDGFEKGNLFFSKQSIINDIEEFISAIAGIPKNLDAEAVLQAIVKQQGILTSPSINFYSFSHSTFQEYLAAKYAYNKPQILENSVENHLNESRWREFFILVSGLLDSSDEFILRIAKQLNVYGRTRIVESLIKQARTLSISSNARRRYTQFQIRLVYFILISSLSLSRALIISTARTRDEALKFNFTGEDRSELQLTMTSLSSFVEDKTSAIIDDHQRVDKLKEILTFTIDTAWTLSDARSCEDVIPKSMQLAQQLNDMHFFSDRQYGMIFSGLKELESHQPLTSTIEVKQGFVRSVQELWFQILEMPIAIINNESKDISKLCEYLNMHLLLFECKYSAIYVSNKGWSDIEKQFFCM
ncbi:MAG: NACHT domain-containing protein [Cyanobacteria bacterium P01_B01_bin.77]